MKALIQIAYWFLIVLSCLALSHLRQPITDMLSNFYMHFFLLGVLFTFLGLYWRLPRTALVSASIAVICFWLVYSYDRVPIKLADQVAKTNGQIYRIMTFNAWEQAKTMSRLKSFLKIEKPDFVVLQEVTLKDWRSLQEIKQLYPYTSYCRDWLCGVALLSRHKWARIEARNFGPHKLPLIQAEFGPKLKGLTVYATHSARPHWKYSTQREQFEHFSGYVKATGRSPAIIAGDMNASVFSSVLSDFAATSSFQSAGEYTVSWPQRLPQLGNLKLPILQLDIDHFFVKQDMTILKKWRGPDLGSDHRPLLMEFRL